jgi:hypothetical protein
LFSFLSLQIAKLQIETGRQIIATYHKDVLCTRQRDTIGLAPCTQEEADTRIFLHVSDATKHGYRKVLIRTVDSDVLVLGIAAVQQLSIDELWVGFASGKSFRYLPTHERCPSCTHSADVSSFAGRGKRTVWYFWKTFSNVTPAFCTLASTPSSVYDQLDVIERFVVVLYDRTSDEEKVNEVRKQLFAQKDMQTYGWPSTNSCCSGGTHKESGLPSRSRLGTDVHR